MRACEGLGTLRGPLDAVTLHSAKMGGAMLAAELASDPDLTVS